MGDHWKHVLSCLTRLGAQPPLDLSQNLFAAGQFPTFVARSPRKKELLNQGIFSYFFL